MTGFEGKKVSLFISMYIQKSLKVFALVSCLNTSLLGEDFGYYL